MTETETRVCNECEEEWTDTGDEVCPFCGSDKTEVRTDVPDAQAENVAAKISPNPDSTAIVLEELEREVKFYENKMDALIRFIKKNYAVKSGHTITREHAIDFLIFNIESAAVPDAGGALTFDEWGWQLNLKKNDDGTYWNRETQMLFECWQAAQRAAPLPAPDEQTETGKEIGT